FSSWVADWFPLLVKVIPQEPFHLILLQKCLDAADRHVAQLMTPCGGVPTLSGNISPEHLHIGVLIVAPDEPLNINVVASQIWRRIEQVEQVAPTKNMFVLERQLYALGRLELIEVSR